MELDFRGLIIEIALNLNSQGTKKIELPPKRPTTFNIYEKKLWLLLITSTWKFSVLICWKKKTVGMNFAPASSNEWIWKNNVSDLSMNHHPLSTITLFPIKQKWIFLQILNQQKREFLISYLESCRSLGRKAQFLVPWEFKFKTTLIMKPVKSSST